MTPLSVEDPWSGAIAPRSAGPPSMRAFGAVMLVGFGVLGALAWWSAVDDGRALRALGAASMTLGIVLFAWALAAPASIRPLHRSWMRGGEAIGKVVSTLVLTALYAFVFTPVGLLMRASGTDPLQRRIRRDASSYWHRRTRCRPTGHEHMS